MPTYRLDLAYDGSGFHGYARQPGVRTIQGELEAALDEVVGRVETSVAGRTDAGVHARGQVVSFATARDIDHKELKRRLNSMVTDEVVVFSILRVSDEFDARFSAIARTYRYHILNDAVPDPLRRHTTWHVSPPLSVTTMNDAARHFLGKRDFASLCRAKSGRNTVREVISAGWVVYQGLVQFEITATAFCHQMVRSMVALCVDVGQGKLRPEDIPGVLEAGDRNAARGAAPPHGLSLWSVAYPSDLEVVESPGGSDR